MNINYLKMVFLDLTCKSNIHYLLISTQNHFTLCEVLPWMFILVFTFLLALKYFNIYIYCLKVERAALCSPNEGHRNV